jgi:hypothetical protein
MTVSWCVLPSSLSLRPKSSALLGTCVRYSRMAIWYTAWPTMLTHMGCVMSGASRLLGRSLRRLSLGGSVASASAAKLSMMRFTHSSCTGLSGSSLRPPEVQAEKKVSVSATMLIVS